jgi:hypothetical protein
MGGVSDGCFVQSIKESMGCMLCEDLNKTSGVAPGAVFRAQQNE